VTTIGDRHSGTAGGALRAGGKPISVEIRLSADAIHASVQHTSGRVNYSAGMLRRVSASELISGALGKSGPGKSSSQRSANARRT